MMIADTVKATALDQLEDHSALLLRRAVLRDDDIAEAIFDLAADGQTEWTLEDWDTLVAGLESSTLTVGEWLILYT